MRRGLMIKVVAGLLLGLPAVAWPCSGPVCEQMFHGIPARKTEIPSNAPAVGVQTALFGESSWDGETSSRSSSLINATLHFPDGGSMSPTTIGTDAVLFAPPGGFHQTLQADAGQELRLEWATQAGLPCSGTQLFAVGPPASMPTTSAVLHVDGFRMWQGTFNGCGGPTGRVQYADLSFDVTPEMEPWLALARWELEIDGQNWSSTEYGSLGHRTVLEAMHSIRDFHVQCDNGDGGTGDNRLRAGTHSARLLAHIVGVGTPVPSNSQLVTFDCVTDQTDAGVAPEIEIDAGIDAGYEFVDAGFRPAFDAGSAPTAVGEMDAEPPTRPGFGCTSVSFVWVPFAALLLLRRRRTDG